MEQKAKINLLIACGGVVLGGLLAGGVVWVWQRNQANCAQEKANITEMERKISQLEGDHKIIQTTEPANPGTSDSTPPNQSGGASAPASFMVGEQDYLKILTVNEVKSSTVGDHWLPLVRHFIDGKWAETSPIPVKYSSEQGFYVPGVGGMTFFWHKKDDKWLKIGTCTESGCEYAQGYKASDLPPAMNRK